MSAFVVDKAHINGMIKAGLSSGPNLKPGWQGPNGYSRLEPETATPTGQMLLDECVKSVSYRYPQDRPEQLPGRCDAEWLIPFVYQPITGRIPKAVEALKLIDCYEYQSCEHPGWETSEAKRFCEALRRCLINRLPGYSEAPWEWKAAYNAL